MARGGVLKTKKLKEGKDDNKSSARRLMNNAR